MEIKERSFQQICIISESSDVGKAEAHGVNGPSSGPEQTSSLLQPGQKPPEPLHCDGSTPYLEITLKVYCVTKSGMGIAAYHATAARTRD